jgi:hypothetical protein
MSQDRSSAPPPGPPYAGGPEFYGRCRGGPAKRSNTNEDYPGCHVINRWKGFGRDAVASGVVSDGVTDFTPGTSQYAEIGFVIDGFEIIGCA